MVGQHQKAAPEWLEVVEVGRDADRLKGANQSAVGRADPVGEGRLGIEDASRRSLGVGDVAVDQARVMGLAARRAVPPQRRAVLVEDRHERLDRVAEADARRQEVPTRLLPPLAPEEKTRVVVGKAAHEVARAEAVVANVEREPLAGLERHRLRPLVAAAADGHGALRTAHGVVRDARRELRLERRVGCDERSGTCRAGQGGEHDRQEPGGLHAGKAIP